MHDEIDRIHEGIEALRGRPLRRDLPVVADRRGQNLGSVLHDDGEVSLEHVVIELDLGDSTLLAGNQDPGTSLSRNCEFSMRTSLTFWSASSGSKSMPAPGRVPRVFLKNECVTTRPWASMMDNP
jgi:hypothetical protein